MNKQQITSAVRWLVTVAGGSVAGWAAARGWVDEQTVTNVLSSETFIGIATSAISLAWGIYSHTTASVVKIVDALPGAKVVPQPGPEGLKVAAALRA